MNIYENLKLDKKLEDGLARFEAIDPSKSFIVQAPAGSGKTSLLTQRFLSLLAVVESPEQIVAMTFTKKAVTEMKLRILEALRFCVDTSESKMLEMSLYDQNTWHLANLALENNLNRGWNLLENPHRLRIKSIDSFNSYLVQQMPLLSKQGGQSGISQQPDKLYAIAARETLNTDSLATAVTNFMVLVNGNRNIAEKMIAGMLAKRDQWMPLLGSINSKGEREIFNGSLASLIEVVLKDLVKDISYAKDILLEIQELINNLEKFDNLNFENPCLSDLEGWRKLDNILLTAKCEVRKIPNIKAVSKQEKEHKKELKELFADLALKNFDGQLGRNIAQISSLPNPAYSEQQWQGAQDLWLLLRTAAAHLKLVFTQQSTTDFIEVAQAASISLGELEQPTDLAQRLDCQIQHLLIDEFQDTSVSQFTLLKKLIAGWSADDNHSLFIVGDPMQSIYRFREAEVGNFLEAWQGRIGQFSLGRQELKVNFRSKKGVVDWVNETFKQVMPKQNVIERGGVKYSASVAFSTKSEPAVTTYWRVNQTKEDAYDECIKQIQHILKTKHPKETIGILGRSKTVLAPLAQHLKDNKISFRAVEIETLAKRQEVQDVESLTRSLIHLGDRPAWIALLRTPALGLDLMDLSALLEDKETRNFPVWSILQQHHLEGFSQLSAGGRIKLNKAYPILDNAIEHIGLVSWSSLIKETWLALDFAQGLNADSDLLNIDAFWQMLAKLETEDNGDISSFDLATNLEKLFALPDASEAAAQIEIMTMHKSKGLEFDYVILPELNRGPRHDDKQLVNWLNYKKDGSEHLIFAPMVQKGKNKENEEDKALVGLVTNFEKEKAIYELGRVLYVACTRAKKQLHLFANIKYTEKKLESDTKIAPTKGSLMSVLWKTQQVAFDKLAKQAEFNQEEVDKDNNPVLVSRLPLEMDSFIEDFASLNLVTKIEQKDKKETDEATETLNLIAEREQENKQVGMVTSVGNLVHKVFETWSNQQFMPTEINETLKIYLSHYLQQSVDNTLLNEALSRVVVSLENAIKNNKLRWALTTDFAQSNNELAITSAGMSFTDKDGNDYIQHIIDRTFVDEDDLRWIVDYKTSFYNNEMQQSQQQFIDEQVKKYQPQLNRYAQLFAEIEHKKQVRVLYFSYIDAWVEV